MVEFSVALFVTESNQILLRKWNVLWDSSKIMHK